MIAAVVGGSIVSGIIGAKGAKDAAGAQIDAAKEGQALITEAADKAKAEVIPIFRQARRDAQAGFEAGLGVVKEAVPAQIDAFQQGNVGAQETLLAGFQPFQQALLGLQPDLSGIQPLQINADTSFLDKELAVSPPPSEQALGFQSLMQEINKDPVGAKQLFDQIKANRQRSFDENIPLGEIMNPPPSGIPDLAVRGVARGKDARSAQGLR